MRRRSDPYTVRLVTVTLKIGIGLYNIPLISDYYRNPPIDQGKLRAYAVNVSVADPGQKRDTWDG